jgi:hypothetical protein
MDRGAIYIGAVKGPQNYHIRLHDSTLDVPLDYRELVFEPIRGARVPLLQVLPALGEQALDGGLLGTHFADNHWDGVWHSIGRHPAVTNRLRNSELLHSVNQRARHSTMEITSRYN